MNRTFPYFSWAFILVLLLNSCTPSLSSLSTLSPGALSSSTSSPSTSSPSTLDSNPIPPLGSSSLRGDPGFSQAAVPSVERMTITDVDRCLQQGKSAYGITLDNTNVRSAADVNVCRVGRIPKGRLVRITKLVTGLSQPAQASDAQVVSDARIGYVEDIQPIFARTCNSCHSGLVQQKGLQVTTYKALMKGSLNGPVVVPGDAEASTLWQMLQLGKMPLIGQLPAADKALIKAWIDEGAPQNRPPALLLPTPTAEPLPSQVDDEQNGSEQNGGEQWVEVDENDFDVTADSCLASKPQAQHLVHSDLMLPVACGFKPSQTELAQLFGSSPAQPIAPLGPNLSGRPPKLIAETANKNTAKTSKQTANPEQDATKAAESKGDTSQSDTTKPEVAAESAPPLAASPVQANVASVNLSAAALGLPPPNDDGDPYLIPRGGFCMEQRLPNNKRGITALAFAPDGTLYLAFDLDMTAQEIDPLIMFDPYHPSRTLAIYNGGLSEILTESGRITGLAYYGGAIYISRAGEVGRIVDGGKYEKLAGGFAVHGQYFHANNGIVINNGYLYISAGGVRDGYSDGPLVGMDENSAQQIVSGGNPWAARIVRAPLDALLSERSINLFQTVARGVRNPYGLTQDPFGRLWFTDNGATNLPDNVSAGDEVNMLVPGAVGDAAAPYYGFPLALNGSQPDWYSKPAVALPNTTAPTSITWAYGTLFFGAYGRNPGLYRLGRSASGEVVAERIIKVWPLLATATAPDGSLWIGTGGGGLFRLTPGC